MQVQILPGVLTFSQSKGGKKMLNVQNAYNLLITFIDNTVYPVAGDVIDDIIYNLNKYYLPDKLKVKLENDKILTGHSEKDAEILNDTMWNILNDVKAYLKDEGLKIYSNKGTSLNKLTASYLYKKYGLKFDNPNFTNKKVRNIEFKVMSPNNFNCIGSGVFEGNPTCFRPDGEHYMAILAYLEAGIIPVEIKDGICDGRLFVGVRYAYKDGENGNDIDITRLSFVLHNIYIKNGSSDFGSIANAFANILSNKTGLIWKRLNGYPDVYIDTTFIDYYLNSSAYTIRCYNFDGNNFNNLDELRNYLKEKNYNEDFLNRYLGYKGNDLINVLSYIYNWWGLEILESFISRLRCVDCGHNATGFIKFIPVCGKHKKLEPKYKCFKCNKKYERENLKIIKTDLGYDYLCENCFKSYICEGCKQRLYNYWVEGNKKICADCLNRDYDMCYMCRTIARKGEYKSIVLGEIVYPICNYCYDDWICSKCEKNIKISSKVNYCANCLSKLIIEEENGEEQARS
jgi:hypothetical protein